MFGFYKYLYKAVDLLTRRGITINVNVNGLNFDQKRGNSVEGETRKEFKAYSDSHTEEFRRSKQESSSESEVMPNFRNIKPPKVNFGEEIEDNNKGR